MDIKQLDERFSVTAQPGIDDIEQLENAGFRTIIASRARNETDDQPDTQTLKNKAESLGMTGYEIPDEPGKYAPDAYRGFCQRFAIIHGPGSRLLSHREARHSLVGLCQGGSLSDRGPAQPSQRSRL